jgi:hypothetical protein
MRARSFFTQFGFGFDSARIRRWRFFGGEGPPAIASRDGERLTNILKCVTPEGETFVSSFSNALFELLLLVFCDLNNLQNAGQHPAATVSLGARAEN